MTGPVLILGGTGEARALARQLVDAGVAVVSSLAGRVRDPALPVGEVRIGGFGGVPGLTDWLTEHRPTAVVDATHPFAQQISRNAAAATTQAGVPLLALRRPQWQPETGDSWIDVPDIRAAATEVGRRSRRAFLTTGRQDVGAFAAQADTWFLIRVVDAPTADLPPHHELLRSRGPYDVAGERELIDRYGVDHLVTKNSGGSMTSAKLTAARDAGVPVIMVRRPALPDGVAAVDSVDAAVGWVAQLR
ncbi:cobalt-precorrin-6A reductase [Jongsikchunia kroppenstedtii]|uniref:cobalt-precorrin-6A reductase n=1 Tax=Jongsikchunia kroppenstedtii TaxID=1121721 RepID=UPI000365523F|nr:cobalt-precorrin-6A reductase [Jongsikchunia kroppenstedtii]